MTPGPADARSPTAPHIEGLALRLLGQPAWRRGEQTWRPLADKDAVLLALLLLDGAQPRARLAALLWPDVAAPRAQANLRQRLFRLRQLWGDRDARELTEDDQGIALSPQVLSDARRTGCGDHSVLDAPLLASLDLHAAGEGLQQWVDDARARWAARRPELLAARASSQEAAGALAGAIASVEELLGLDALQEHAWRRLMRLHFLRGDRAAAVRAFERCEAVLRDELGLKPSTETLALLAQVEQLAGATFAAPQPGASGRRGPLPPGLLRPPRVVGRAAELQAMQDAWAHDRSFVLMAQAGAGKSRLLADFATLTPGVLVVAARPGDEVVPYGSAARVLRAVLSAAEQPERLWPDARHRAELARLLPELGPAPAAPGLEALLHGAVEHLMQRAAAAQALAVLVDDWQHADAASQTLFMRLAASAPRGWGFATRPSAGPSLQAWLSSSVRPQAIVLSGLDPAALAELLASLALPTLHDHAHAAAALQRHCGGNPLFVLETLKHMWRATASNLSEPGVWTQLPLPDSVEFVLQRRLEALSPLAVTVARVAAVAGADFRAQVAADVVGCGLLELSAPFGELEQAQWLRGDTFAHESVFDVTLRSVPQAMRSILHGGVAASLERQDAPAERVAQHHASAQNWRPAALASRRAAAKAQHLGRSIECLAHERAAAGWFDRAGDHDAAFAARVASISACMGSEGTHAATALCEQLLQQARNAEQRLSLRLAQASMALAAYDGVLAASAALAALQDAAPGSDDQLRAEVMRAAGWALLGQLAPALAALDALRTRLEAFDDAADAAELWSQLALVQHRAGRIQSCIEALERQRLLARRTGQVETEAAALASLSGQLNAAGEPDRAATLARDAIALYERLGSESSAMTSRIGLAVVLLGLDELQEARTLLEQTLVYTLRTARDSDLRLAVEDLRAAWWLRVGDGARALAELSESPALTMTRQVSRLILRGQAAELQGDAAAARDHWQTLHELDSAGCDEALRLRGRALATAAVGLEEAMAALAALQGIAEDAGFPAGRVVIVQARTQRLFGAGRMHEAVASARELMTLRDQARHRFSSRAELLALVCRVLDASGDHGEAQALRAEAAHWAGVSVLPQLPVPLQAAWRAHPGHAGLGL